MARGQEPLPASVKQWRDGNGEPGEHADPLDGRPHGLVDMALYHGGGCDDTDADWLSPETVSTHQTLGSQRD